MALRDVNIFEKHVEKIVLGAAGAGAAFMAYLAMQPVTVEPPPGVPFQVSTSGEHGVEAVIHSALGEPLGPLSAEQVAALEKKPERTVEESIALIKFYGKPNVMPVDYVKLFEAQAKDRPLDAELVKVTEHFPSFAGANMSPSFTAVKVLDGTFTLKTPDVDVVAPKMVHAHAEQFQVTTVDPSKIVLPLPAGAALPTVEKNAVIIEGYIPLGQMLKQMLMEREYKSRIPDNRNRALVQNIHVERQEILPKGGTTGWTDVPPPKNATPVEKISWGTVSGEDKVTSVIAQVDSQFKEILLPDFDRDSQGVPIPPPILTEPLPSGIDQENKEVQAALEALKAGTVVPGGRPAAMVTAGGASQPATLLPQDIQSIKALPDVPFTFWDENIKPGHTYNYRVTVELVNPVYAWEQGLKNPADKAKPMLATAPVVINNVHVSADVEFFVSDSPSHKDQVDVRVFKQANSRWYMTDVSIPLGARITGKVVQRDVVPPVVMNVDTEYTLVDMQSNGHNVHAVLRDGQGNLITRDSSTDWNNNVEQERLLHETLKATATTQGSETQPSGAAITPTRSGGTTTPPTTRRSTTPTPVRPAGR